MTHISTHLADYASLSPDFYGLEDINQAIDSLLKRCSYLPDTERVVLKQTCHFAAIAHDGQKRKSGEPYICHPVKVAEILAHSVRFDLPVLQAGVLHDVLEDCEDYTKPIMIATFGEEVTYLVDGVSKFEKIKDATRESQQAKTFAKMVGAMQKDPRVIMIKLADRMHNMQTLGAMPTSKKGRIIQETLSVYVPIAERLGMYQFKTALEEQAFRNQYPWRYRVVKRMIAGDVEREALVKEVRHEILSQLEAHGLSADVRLRQRNIVNTYHKLQKSLKTGRDLSKTSLPFVIIAESTDDCYRILGIVHRIYKPINHKLADFIAVPKVNAYQSLHTSVILGKGLVANFQIRTLRMHYIAEQGIIAMYRLQNETEIERSQDKPILRFLDSMKSLQDVLPNPEDYYNAIKDDLSGENIQVLTPKGEPLSLPEGATPIDFAYKLHSSLGNQVERVRVNDIEVPLDHVLANEQTVELITNIHAKPKVEWFQFVKTSQARSSIRYYFRELPQSERIVAGKAALLEYFEQHDIYLEDPDQKLAGFAKQFAEDATHLYEKTALGEVDLARLFDMMQASGAKHAFTKHLSIRIANRPNVLAHIVRVIGEAGINIDHVDSVAGFTKVGITFKFILSFDAMPQFDEAVNTLKNLEFVSYLKIKEADHEQENH